MTTIQQTPSPISSKSENSRSLSHDSSNALSTTMRLDQSNQLQRSQTHAIPSAHNTKQSPCMTSQTSTRMSLLTPLLSSADATAALLNRFQWTSNSLSSSAAPQLNSMSHHQQQQQQQHNNASSQSNHPVAASAPPPPTHHHSHAPKTSVALLES